MNRLGRLLLITAVGVVMISACTAPRSLSPAKAVAIPALYTPGSADPQPDQEKGQPFQVAETGPSGTVPHENLEGGVWVLFNKPVVPLAKLGKPITASGALSISPVVDGVYRWYGSRLLSFEPKGQLAPATEYKVAINRSLKSLGGEALSGDTDFSFRTEPLGIVALSPQGDDVIPEASREIVVTFNFPVDLPTILPSIRLEADGQAVRFKASLPVITDRRQLGPYENADRLVSLKPFGDLPRDADVKVIIRSGARPRPENYGTSQDIVQGFHTLKPLELETSEVAMSGPAPSAILRFNHALSEPTVLANLRIPLKGYQAASHLDVSGAWVYLSQLPVRFESSFSLQILRGLKDVYGQALLEDKTVSLEVGPAATYVMFHATGQKLLESQFTPRVAVEYQNVISGKYGIGSLKEPFLSKPGEPNRRLDTRRVPRNTRAFRAVRPFPVSQRRPQGGRMAFVGLHGEVRGKRHAAGGKRRPCRPSHRHRRLSACVVQLDGRSCRLALHGGSAVQRGGHSPQGRPAPRFRHDGRLGAGRAVPRAGRPHGGVPGA